MYVTTSTSGRPKTFIKINMAADEYIREGHVAQWELLTKSPREKIRQRHVSVEKRACVSRCEQTCSSIVENEMSQRALQTNFEALTGQLLITYFGHLGVTLETFHRNDRTKLDPFQMQFSHLIF